MAEPLDQLHDRTGEFVAPVELVSASAEQVIVSATTPANCARCAAGAGCGQAQFRVLPFSDRKTMTLSRSAVTQTGLLAGEKLLVVMSAKSVLLCSLLLYGLPLLGLVFGALLGQFAVDNFSPAGSMGEDFANGIPAVSAAAGLGLALFGVRKMPLQQYSQVRVDREQ